MQKVFFNYLFNKSKLRTLLTWCIINTGQYNTIKLAENLKNIGFKYATIAGISLGIDDFETISTKKDLIAKNYDNIHSLENYYELGLINEVDKSEYLISNWQKVSEILKNDINAKFKSVNKLNPIYMMAFSGARGNISQVRQLIGMRGLMADPSGQIIHLPITSNFREGLTITEYLISCYGARKGVVDTALRTATAGYLTRRLVDTAQHVIISQLDCLTLKGVFLTTLAKKGKVITSLEEQLYGRVLAVDVKLNNTRFSRNQQIDNSIASILSKNFRQVYIRSPLTCRAPTLTICQLCYGWNLSHLRLISLGEVVGIIAAQSIGEPGTQLTMRTFHTGGVFSGSAITHLYAPFSGVVNYSTTLQGIPIHTYENKFFLLVQTKGLIIINSTKPVSYNKKDKLTFKEKILNNRIFSKKFEALPYTMLFVKNKEKVEYNQLIAKKYSFQSTTQQIRAYYYILSKLEGEIIVNDYNNIQKTFNRKTKFWILCGKIYKPPLNVRLFPKIGDFISTSFPIAKLRLLNTSPSFLRRLLLKRSNLNNSSANQQKARILLYTEYPLYSFLLNNLIALNKCTLVKPFALKTIENENIIRFKLFNKKQYTFFCNSTSFSKEKRINLNTQKLEQSQIFLYNNIHSEYSEYKLKKLSSTKLVWFMPQFFIKNDLKFFQNMINPYTLIRRTNKVIFFGTVTMTIVRDKYMSFKLNETNKTSFQKNVLFTKRNYFNIFFRTTDLSFIHSFLLKKIEEEEEEQEQEQEQEEEQEEQEEQKNLLLYPKSSLRCFTQNFLSKYVNYRQKDYFLSDNTIIFSRIKFYSVNTLIKPIFFIKKFSHKRFSFTNFFGNLLVNYSFSFCCEKTTSNFLFFYMKNILNHQIIFDHNQILKFISLITSCTSFLDRFGLFNDIFIFWKHQLVSKFINNYAYSYLILNNSSTSPMLIVTYFNRFYNQIMTNTIPLIHKESILNFFSPFFFVKTRKNFSFLNKDIKENTFLSKKLVNLQKDFFDIKLDMTFSDSISFYSLFNLNLLSGCILSLTEFKQIKSISNLTIEHLNNFYLENFKIPQFLREFGGISKKLKFWNFIELAYTRKYFTILINPISFHLKLSDFFVIHRNNQTFLKIFSDTFYSNKWNEKIFLEKKVSSNLLFTQLKLNINTSLYFILKNIKTFPIISQTNFKNLFLNYNDNISNFILAQRFKELFLKNSFHLQYSNLYSINSPLFNKRLPSQVSFSGLYKKFNISYCLDIPLLISTYLYKYSYVTILRLRYLFFMFKPLQIVNLISKNDFFLPEISDHLTNTNTLKVINTTTRNFNLFFKCSITNPIFQRTFHRENFSQIVKDRILFSSQHLDWMPRGITLATISFLSPYEGEVLFSKFSKYSNSNIICNQLIILTKKDINTFSLFRNRKQNVLIQKCDLRVGYFINTANILEILINLGNLISFTTLISPNKRSKNFGQFIGFANNFFITRKGKPLLYPLNGLFYVWNGDFIYVNSPIMTLLYSKLKAGDIVQGIPKIEHFFEARKGSKNTSSEFQSNLYFKLHIIFTSFKRKLCVQRATKRSIAKIQKIVIDGILRVYCSQGISISRKHFEVIVRQMTSKAVVIDGGETGLVEGEFISLYKMELINDQMLEKPVIYEPLVLGLTQTSLKTESFISSASFQETTRVLSQASIEKKMDFLYGLKESVILGYLVPGGTGIISVILAGIF